ncbi:Daunorubicin/doxorubicin resistance ATP-binding protein DrrA [Posidoniimonas polymericola]|uniref:Daunorubicin/doxorubicin resistance ATP-binding protein DrrA n=1 Tax=Posidoniimonas polymericola TaxID=2528002 RepID=A0A5C5YS01_9BACT|nr:ABC transporter ATP-binding protein [Posidoniimonas polymericola]TWT77510.1 Daunorubicin/doxorubicin resistance ATP-binding protein DrrA [Posidoniimonas polymericola]
MDNQVAAVHVADLRYKYGDREALRGLSLDVRPGELFAVLGPNGSGKTTFFRILSTLAPLQQGTVSVFGADLKTQADQVRAALGVVFQAPSLDKHLTVNENLRCHGLLYGLSGATLLRRCEEMLEQLGVADRAEDKVGDLSGGLRRRVELAQGMLHSPRLLLLDEPSTGLDPAARSDLWRYLAQARDAEGVTVLTTTHLLEEADRADRIAIVHEGRVAALDTPDALKSQVGGDSITLRTENPSELAAAITEKFDVPANVLDHSVRLEQPGGAAWAPKLFEAFGDRITELTIGKPSLEDVFIDRTGHRFFGSEFKSAEETAKKKKRKH